MAAAAELLLHVLLGPLPTCTLGEVQK